MTLRSEILARPKKCLLHNRRTNWNLFREKIETSLNTKIPLKTTENVENAVEHFNSTIQMAAWDSTPMDHTISSRLTYSKEIIIKVAEKRKLRKQWQLTRCPLIKTRLNRSIKELKRLLNKERNSNVQEYL